MTERDDVWDISGLFEAGEDPRDASKRDERLFEERLRELEDREKYCRLVLTLSLVALVTTVICARVLEWGVTGR